MTNKPVTISDDEVDAFVALTKTPMGLKAALSAFLLARVPEPLDTEAARDRSWTDRCYGFNDCRELILKPPAASSR